MELPVRRTTILPLLTPPAVSMVRQWTADSVSEDKVILFTSSKQPGYRRLEFQTEGTYVETSRRR
jgi:hypothetical protein